MASGDQPSQIESSQNASEMDSASTKHYHHGDLKKSLIKVANELLQKEGADGLSLRVIAAAAGVSHMAPYAHFKNKKELIQAIAAEGFDRMADAMEVDRGDLTTAPELILSYGTSYLKFATDNPELYRLMLGQVETQGKKNRDSESVIKKPALSEELKLRSKRPYMLLRDAFAMLSSDPEVVRIKAMGAWSLVHGMSALMISGHIELPDNLSLKTFLAQAAIQSV